MSKNKFDNYVNLFYQNKSVPNYDKLFYKNVQDLKTKYGSPDRYWSSSSIFRFKLFKISKSSDRMILPEKFDKKILEQSQLLQKFYD